MQQKSWKSTITDKFLSTMLDHQGGDLASVHADSLLACIESCDSTDGCVDVSLSGVSRVQHLDDHENLLISAECSLPVT